ncbi:hypothetical protein [Microbulbifer hainanensis]|uniref:hypothetical protein n=1 Tax=Microbulbifer hainanensis TaxID=2735675 RepID=UPI001868AFC9|nr:hypothetical protein [Microbulbifer hainanensis]
MSGRKNKNKHRGPQRAPSTDLLDELNSIRDLLGSDELGDIPLLDQVAAPATSEPPKMTAPAPQRQPVQEPLDESELPILFSPVDEELPEDYRAELNESELALLRPLQNLPAKQATAAPSKPKPEEQQQELFGESAASEENPFLPAHIRARLTGGRVPRDEPEVAAAPAEPPAQRDTAPPAGDPEPATEAPAELETETEILAEPPPEENAELPQDTPHRRRESQRQQLVDRLVAKQLPELERQLRARIERMIDELEANR